MCLNLHILGQTFIYCFYTHSLRGYSVPRQQASVIWELTQVPLKGLEGLKSELRKDFLNFLCLLVSYFVATVCQDARAIAQLSIIVQARRCSLPSISSLDNSLINLLLLQLRILCFYALFWL